MFKGLAIAVVFLVPLGLGAQGDVYGPALRADDLANTPIGQAGTQVSYRFRADPGGVFQGARPFIIWSFKRKGYHAGTGGTLKVELREDDGSPAHLPSDRVLATNVQRLGRMGPVGPRPAHQRRSAILFPAAALRKHPMDYLFLKRTSRPDPVSAVLPPGFRLVFWRPGFRLRPRGFPARPFLLWGLWHRLKVYATPDYGMALIYEGAQLVHRTCLLPAHFRFPFMVRGDLQTAGIWTRPDRRGMGLALVALQGSLRRMADPERTLWYMVREDNQPSLRLAEKGGFQLFGRGRKLPSRAFGLLGAFQITEVHDGRPPQLPPRLPPTVPGMPIR